MHLQILKKEILTEPKSLRDRTDVENYLSGHIFLETEHWHLQKPL